MTVREPLAVWYLQYWGKGAVLSRGILREIRHRWRIWKLRVNPQALGDLGKYEINFVFGGGQRQVSGRMNRCPCSVIASKSRKPNQWILYKIELLVYCSLDLGVFETEIVGLAVKVSK